MTEKEQIFDPKEEARILPGAIKKKEEYLFGLSSELDVLKLKMDTIESTVLETVRKEKDSDGKDVYSSDVKRKSEVNRRLQDHNEYQASLSLALEKRKEQAQENINLSFFKNRLRSVEIISRLGV